MNAMLVIICRENSIAIQSSDRRQNRRMAMAETAAIGTRSPAAITICMEIPSRSTSACISGWSSSSGRSKPTTNPVWRAPTSAR